VVVAQTTGFLLALCRIGSVRFVETTSVHWYKATSETFNTAATLLDEEPIRKEMANLRELVKVSNR
jgi:hypothetical protein